MGNEIWNIKTDESLIKNPYKQVEIIATTQVNDGGFVAVSNSQWIFKYTGEDISESEGLILQIGANEGQDIKLHIGDVSTKALGINKVYINNKEYAQNSIGLIDKAIEKVSAERSKLGAYQNRLEHIIANLDNTSENLQASESRIRNLDMAKEMMEFTKNNILQQSSQAILAQANQMPQLVLQLLDFK